MNTPRGFTIVELTVILAVVAILSTVVLVNAGEARKVARDKERMVMLDQISVAMRLYKEQFGVYPPKCSEVTETWAGPGPEAQSWLGECDEYVTGLVPDFMSALPQDPSAEDEMNKGIMYRVNGNGTEYKLLFRRTVESQTLISGDPYARCDSSCSEAACDEQDSFAVYYDLAPGDGAGSECW